jgi:hypothetical protein
MESLIGADCEAWTSSGGRGKPYPVPHPSLPDLGKRTTQLTDKIASTDWAIGEIYAD